MKILVAGPVGSGKTTQAKLLAEYLDVPMVGMGEVLREISKKDNPKGKLLRDDLDKGRLVDDQIVAKIIKERISQKDCETGFVMDGYPRSLPQIELFDPGFDRVFYLDLDDEIVIGRLAKRGREDDTPELIRKRLGIYHELTEPLLTYLDGQGILQRIGDDDEIGKIQAKLRSYLES